MGGSSSKAERKLTVDNENAIQVSQEVLDRLQEQLQNKPPARQQPIPHMYPPPEYTQQLLHKQAEEEQYWAQRVENLKRAHAKINAGMDLEYQQTMQEANELFNSAKKYRAVNRVLPCQEEKAKVLECYNSNPAQTLLCSVLVNQFNDCVCRSRDAAISATS